MTPSRPEFHLALSQLATTNDPPSTQDAAFLREVVDGLDGQADEIRTQLQALEEKLQVVERNRKFFRPMLSPVRRVPLEILGEVFALIVEMDPFLNNTLATLSFVCKSWRRAALGMPKLWTRVALDPSVPAFSYEAAAAWFNRSGTLSRSVRVGAEKCGPGESCLGRKTCAFSKRALAEILIRTPHIQHIAIGCPTPNCSQNLFTSLISVHSYSPPSPWDAVKSLAISADWSGGWKESSAPSFNCLPAALTALQLDLPDIDYMPNGWDVRDIPTMPRASLKRLTSLHLGCDWGADAIFGVLGHCSDLERATIDLGGGYDFAAGSDPIHERGYTFPKLTVLQLQSAQMDTLDLLQHLKMPALLELSIAFGTTGRWIPGLDFDGPLIDFDEATAAALRLLLRGGDHTRPSTLRSLHITNGDFANELIVHTLEPLHSLSELTLDNVAFGRTTFTQLSSANQLPNLKSLRLLRIHTDPEKLIDLPAFVEKRGTKLEVSQCEERDCICRSS